MPDSLVTWILTAAMFPLLAGVRYFRTLDTNFWRTARTPLLGGLAAGVLIRLTGTSAAFVHALVAGVVLTLAALYVRLHGRESEPADGMLLGALTGTAASIPLLAGGTAEAGQLAECVAAGAVSGYGITFASTYVGEKRRQLWIDAVTAAVAVGAAFVPGLLVRQGLAEPRHIAIAIVSAIPLLLIVTVFRQWPDIRAELRHEASLGFLDDAEVRPTAHPILRLGRRGWQDAGARRQFVRLATEIALRKRRQRERSDEAARLYQLEIMKLRMEMQEMARIDRAMTQAELPVDEEVASDTIRSTR